MPNGQMTSTELRTDGYLFYSDIANDTLVYTYNGVHLRNGKMANVGDNVAFEAHTNHVSTVLP